MITAGHPDDLGGICCELKPMLDQDLFTLCECCEELQANARIHPFGHPIVARQLDTLRSWEGSWSKEVDGPVACGLYVPHRRKPQCPNQLLDGVRRTCPVSEKASSLKSNNASNSVLVIMFNTSGSSSDVPSFPLLPAGSSKICANTGE